MANNEEEMRSRGKSAGVEIADYGVLCLDSLRLGIPDSTQESGTKIGSDEASRRVGGHEELKVRGTPT